MCVYVRLCRSERRGDKGEQSRTPPNSTWWGYEWGYGAVPRPIVRGIGKYRNNPTNKGALAGVESPRA